MNWYQFLLRALVTLLTEVSSSFGQSYEHLSVHPDKNLSMTVQGVCEGLPAGDVQISLSVETADTIMRVGYASHNTQIFVEELG